MSLSEANKVLRALPAGLTAERAQDLASGVRRVMIFKTLWYPEILGPMEQSAKKFLKDMGVSDEAIETVMVPGSFELPLAVAQAAHAPDDSGGVPLDFAVALGCIVRGETPHFDFVSKAAADGLMRVQLDLEIPVGFGVLTVENLDQARSRLDKGAEAAHAAFFMYVNRGAPIKRAPKEF